MPEPMTDLANLREWLMDWLARLQVTVPTTGPAAGLIQAESMADALMPVFDPLLAEVDRLTAERATFDQRQRALRAQVLGVADDMAAAAQRGPGLGPYINRLNNIVRMAPGDQPVESKFQPPNLDSPAANPSLVGGTPAQPLRDFLSWLIAMDDPADEVGREARRTVTLTRIIDRARKVSRWLPSTTPDTVTTEGLS